LATPNTANDLVQQLKKQQTAQAIQLKKEAKRVL
jgi:hypothetical protein